MLTKALRHKKSGEEELDMEVIKQIADDYRDGEISDEGLAATLIIAAYDSGFAEGMRESERRMEQTAMLMSCMAGHA